MLTPLKKRAQRSRTNRQCAPTRSQPPKPSSHAKPSPHPVSQRQPPKAPHRAPIRGNEVIRRAINGGGAAKAAAVAGLRREGSTGESKRFAKAVLTPEFD